MVIENTPLVALNAHLLAGEGSYRSAGISSYIANLLCGLADIASLSMRVQVLVGRGYIPEAARGLVAWRSRMDTRRPQMRIVWEQVILPRLLRSLGVDVLHALAFVGPYVSVCPQVVTVHDLSFLRFPEFFKHGNRLYLGTMTGIACRRAAAVIAVSEYTAREVATLLRVPQARIHTVYHGVAATYRPLAKDAVARFRQAQGLPERFVLHVGTLEPRKNLLRLVRAFARLAASDVHLVLAGGRGWLYETLFAEVERLDLTARVHFPGFVALETLPLWYNAAEVFAYISTYEGFGLPVLEALACGTPTVTAATTSLPEAAGDGALLVPPEDEAAIAEGLHRLLTDVGLRERVRAQGLAHAAGFTWAKTAQETVAVYQQVLAS